MNRISKTQIHVGSGRSSVVRPSFDVRLWPDWGFLLQDLPLKKAHRFLLGNFWLHKLVIFWFSTTDSMLRPLRCQPGLQGDVSIRICGGSALQKHMELPCISSLHDISCPHIPCCHPFTVLIHSRPKKTRNEDNLMREPYPSIWIEKFASVKFPNSN